MSDVASDQPNAEPKGTSLPWLVYGQIAAMLGAFSLLVFLQDFVDLGLKGIVAQAFDGWVHYVRPVVGTPLHWAVEHLPETWRFHVTDGVKDYIAVGIVSASSFNRALGIKLTSLLRVRDLDLSRIGVSDVFWLTLAAIFLLLGQLVSLLAWPIAPVVLVIAVFEWARGAGDFSSVSVYTQWIAPLTYLGLIYAANTWLL